MADAVKTIVVLGKPGSGKGTQAKLLRDKLGYDYFTTGDRFRELREQNNAIGRRVKEVYDSGDLIPDWFPIFLFEEKLFQLGEDDGLILEGAIRTQGQAEAFHEVAEWFGRDYTAINIKVSDEEVTHRHLERKRDDLDSIERIKIRLEEYRNKTVPAITFFKGKGKLLEIGGEKKIEEVFAEICKKIGVSLS